MTPTTKAGRALLEREAYNSRSFALITAEAVIAIEQEARADEAEALRAALEGLVRKMAPHSGSCCTFDDDGTVRVTRESCKCGPVERAAHEVLDWYGTTRKRGTRPTGSSAALATPAAPAADPS